MTTTTAAKVICAECRHENEAERIYCHNCGERLDRSGVVVQKEVEDPKETHRRLRKMLEGPSRTRQNFFVAGKLMLAAAATAVLVQMALPPEEFPPATKATAPQIDLALENAVLRSTDLNYSQNDANAYLTYRLSGKKKALNKSFLDFERAAVIFKEGACVVGWERSIFGYSIYARSMVRLQTNSGKISATNVGGWIGRLPIHPKLMEYGDVIFADVWSALDRERKLVAKMGGVEFHDGSVTLSAPHH
jgi:hypothetical protein